MDPDPPLTKIVDPDPPEVKRILSPGFYVCLFGGEGGGPNQEI